MLVAVSSLSSDVEKNSSTGGDRSDDCKDDPQPDVAEWLVLDPSLAPARSVRSSRGSIRSITGAIGLGPSGILSFSGLAFSGDIFSGGLVSGGSGGLVSGDLGCSVVSGLLSSSLGMKAGNPPAGHLLRNSGCFLSGCFLSGCFLSGCFLSGCFLSGCFLSGYLVSGGLGFGGDGLVAGGPGFSGSFCVAENRIYAGNFRGEFLTFDLLASFGFNFGNDVILNVVKSFDALLTDF